MSELTPEQQLEQIQISKEQAERSVKLLEAFERLRNNPDFNLLISKSYFQEEASRLVMLKADSSFQSPERKDLLSDSMAGISSLNMFFNSVVQMGQMSRESLNEYVEAEEEILADDSVEIEGVH